MKVKGNGQAKILTADELRRLFADGFKSERVGEARRRHRRLFAICLYTGCRVSEALQLKTTDIKSCCIIFRKATTKGKLKTRCRGYPTGASLILGSIPNTIMNVKTVDINVSTMTIEELLLLINEETEIIITQDSKPLARLMLIASASENRIPGLHPGAISTTDDFDEPLPEEFWTGKA